jgi:hypothetical protein
MGCMGWWLGYPAQRSDRNSRRHNHVGVSSVSWSSASPVHVFGVEVAGHQDRQSPAETRGKVPSDQWAGRREISRKYFHQSARHCDLKGSSLQVGQARNGHRVVVNTTED